MNHELFKIERLLEVGRLREAGELIGKALAEDPDDVDIRTAAGRLYYLANDNDEARAQLQSALVNAPKHRVARFMLHLVHVEEEEFDQAEALITELIREEPANATFLALYARLMVLTFHIDKARALLEEAYRLDPHDREARFVNLLIAVVERRRGDADEQLADLLRESPDDQRVLWSLYRVLCERRRHRAAFAIGQQLLRLQPTNTSLIEALVELRTLTHWVAIPAYPFTRWGWGAVAAAWITAIVVIRAIAKVNPPLAGTLGLIYFVYVVYTWVYPPLLKRWIRWRGVS